MTMFHENLSGEEAPFGVVTFSGENAAKLPARGSAVVQAQVRAHTLAKIVLATLLKMLMLHG